jgi:uncharacterized protein
MFQTSILTSANERPPRFLPLFDAVRVERLVNRQEAEVLSFLSQRSIHTVVMMSLILDNGIVSKLNRGTFYGCRDINGRLEGVALVGHATLIETVSDRALMALAQVARECPYTHMIMGEQDRVDDFWACYAEVGVERRLACREWLFELLWPVEAVKPTNSLRVATSAELELVMPIQAELAFEESGVNPMIVDPEGFRKRCLRRIEQGRTWVVIENGSLIFKADIISQTCAVIYLEGIWVREDRRHTGEGQRFLSELSQRLLQEADSICLLVNETNKRAHNFYRKCGFQFRATYETVFLPQKERLPN